MESNVRMKDIGGGKASSRGRLKRRTVAPDPAVQRKVTPKVKAGDAFALRGQQRPAIKRKVGAGGNQRKFIKMNKTTTDVSKKTGTGHQPGVDTLPENTAPQPATRDLMPPNEWAALLRSIESEVAPAKADEVEVAANDLWEKLSSTRWLKEPPTEDEDEEAEEQEINRSSTVRN